MSNFKSSKETRKIFSISDQTLNNWKRWGKIKFIQINSRKVLYDIDSVTTAFSEEKTKRINIIYGRVSNSSQKEHLVNQIDVINQFANSNGYVVDKIYQDVASGMNENRIDFNKLIDDVVNYRVNKVFITYKDRLTRFGFSYFENLFKKFGTEIIVLNEADSSIKFEQELTEDFISIIHYFSMRMFSNRKKILKEMKKSLELTQK